MKSLNNHQVEERFKKCKYKPYIIDSAIKPFTIRNLTFDRRLSILIPGTPISDSRPRHTTSGDGIGYMYNPHKAALMKIFKKACEKANFDTDNICVISPMYAVIRAYFAINKVDHKSFKDNNLFPLLMKAEVSSQNEKDVDNIEKVHYDVMQDMENMLIFDDAYIVKNDTEKIAVLDEEEERIEIEFFYCSKVPQVYLDILTRRKEYFGYLISPSYKAINNIPDHKWKKVFYKNVIDFLTNSKRPGDIMSRAREIVNYAYKTHQLRWIEDGKNKEIVKEKIINNIQSIYNQIKGKKKLNK